MIGKAMAALTTAQRRPFLTVALIAGILRLAFALATFAHNEPWLIPDEGQYVELATSVASGHGAEAWFPGYGQSLYDSTRVFMVPLVVLFKVAGPSRLIGQLWAVSFGVLTAVGTALLAKRVAGNRAALIAGTLVAVVPSQVLWSSVVLRESLVWFGLVLVALAVARSFDERHSPTTSLAFGGVALLGLGFLRVQTMLAAAWAILIVAALLPRPHRLIRCASAGVIVLLVPLVAGAGPAGLDLVRREAPVLATRRTQLSAGAESAFTPTSLLSAPDDPVRRASDDPEVSGRGVGREMDVGAGHGKRTVRMHDGTVYVVDEGLDANLSAIPRGAEATMIRPFPWENRSGAAMRLAGVENILWYALYGLALVGVWWGRRSLEVLAFPLVAGGAILLANALTQGNLGTAFRHRGQLLWIVALLAAVAMEHLLTARSENSSMATEDDHLDEGSPTALVRRAPSQSG